MGQLINEKRFINNNILEFENRLEAQITRFLDKTPTFVTYYHINEIETTVDGGFGNVEKHLGPNSPVRYNKITDFPIYGLEQIQLQLSDEEHGIDSNYDGEGIILPNTVIPSPNDFFIINYLDQNFLFQITSINYDTIKSNNYYRIEYSFYNTSGEYKHYLEKQVIEDYYCIFENIGTEDKCLLRTDEFDKIIEIDQLYNTIMNLYIKLYYVKKYNSLLSMFQMPQVNPKSENFGGHEKIYDLFLTEFINKNKLFVVRNTYDTIQLSEEDEVIAFPIIYETSFYKALEKRDKSMVKIWKYFVRPISMQHSVFNYYSDTRVMSVMFEFREGLNYLPVELIEKILSNKKDGTEKIYEKLLIDYFNNNIENLNQIDINELKDYKYLAIDKDAYILIPAMLFIIRYYYKKFMSEYKNI